MRRICDRLDHHFLMPAQSEHLNIKEADGEWLIEFQNKRYVFPAEDVLVLPVDNITAERLAEHICGQLLKKIQELASANISSMTVGVEEAPGQTAYYKRSL